MAGRGPHWNGRSLRSSANGPQGHATHHRGLAAYVVHVVELDVGVQQDGARRVGDERELAVQRRQLLHRPAGDSKTLRFLSYSMAVNISLHHKRGMCLIGFDGQMCAKKEGLN